MIMVKNITEEQVRNALGELAIYIRAGSWKRPQSTHALFRRVGVNKWHSCAIGAAYEALGGRKRIDSAVDAVNTIEEVIGIPIMGHQIQISSPIQRKDSIYGFVAWLNDEHKLTREAIADILEDRNREIVIEIRED
jgi:hypothetical protein